MIKKEQIIKGIGMSIVIGLGVYMGTSLMPNLMSKMNVKSMKVTTTPEA